MICGGSGCGGAGRNVITPGATGSGAAGWLLRVYVVVVVVVCDWVTGKGWAVVVLVEVVGLYLKVRMPWLSVEVVVGTGVQMHVVGDGSGVLDGGPEEVVA